GRRLHPVVLRFGRRRRDAARRRKFCKAAGKLPEPGTRGATKDRSSRTRCFGVKGPTGCLTPKELHRTPPATSRATSGCTRRSVAARRVWESCRHLVPSAA